MALKTELRKMLPDGVFPKVSIERSRIMRSIKAANNRSTERRLRAALVSAGLRDWRVRDRNRPGRPDFFFEKAELAIFVDGCFWHGCPACYQAPRTNSAFWTAKINVNRAKDKSVTVSLRRSGAIVLRFWEHELKSDLRSCIDRIRVSLTKT